MTSENCRLLLIGNPTTMSGTFRRAFHEESHLYHPITISALESPNVREERIVIRGLTTRRWVEERKRVWGEENPIYQARVMGEFPDQGEDTLIALSWVEGAVAHEHQDESCQEPAVIAVDVARFGSDKSVILRRRGMVVEDIQAYHGLDTMKLVARVIDAIQAWQPQEVVVDEVGIGAGVVDRLRELGYRVQGINVGRPAQEREHYANLRAEGFWGLRQLFTEGSVAIPSDSDLMGQLAALRYTFDSVGRVVMESKEEMRHRGLSSPDKADALMLAFLSNKRKVKLWG